MFQISEVAMQNAETQKALLGLNNFHARETSHLSLQDWQLLVGQAFTATCIGADAFLVAIDQDAKYDNANFAWFRSRYDRFVYVDRIVVSEALRGTGAAQALYRSLFGLAQKAGQKRVVCEVNIDPPNFGSDVFHRKMGFAEVGRAELPDRRKTVRYLAKSIDPAVD